MEGAREDPGPVDIERLLREGVWVSRLARRLVGDEASAEDVVQNTWIAALRHGPAEEGRLRPWLAHVVRNFAHQEQRARKRRQDREMASARPESEPSAHETAERLETQRRLVEALAEIAEPYRTTVMRHYYDGLPAAEIARLEGLPSATVRWRLMRGIEELRAKLDERFGDRRAWSLALAPLANPHAAAHVTAAAGSGALFGVFVMSTIARTALVAALVVTASLGVFLLTRSSEPLAPATGLSPTALAGADESNEVSKPASEIAAAEPSVERAALTATSEPTAQDPKSAAVNTRARIEGRFLDSEGRPLEGVTVTEPLSADKQPVKSDARGRFDFETGIVAARGPLLGANGGPTQAANFFAERSGYASHFGRVNLEPGATAHAGDVVLQYGGSVAGVVIGVDGAPITDACVVVLASELTGDVEQLRRSGPRVFLFPGAPQAKSSASGAFEIAGVPARAMRAWAGRDGMRWAMSEPFEVPVHGVANRVVLTLEPLAPEDRVEGSVLDPEGNPIPNADVTYRYPQVNSIGQSGIRTDENGHFRILVPARAPLDLEVSDRRDRWPRISAKAVRPGTLDCVLRFHEARSIELVFEDEKGVPVPSAAFSALGLNGDWGLPSEPETQRENARASMVVPEESFTIEAWANGRARVQLGPFRPELVPSQLVFRLESLPGLRGRVVAGDSPVSGARLHLHPFLPTGTRIAPSGFPMRIDEGQSEVATTDSKGQFALTVRKPGSYAILCESEGHALAELTLLDVDPMKGRDDLVISVGNGGAIEGRVILPKGRDARDFIVGINRFDGRPRTQHVDADGRFRFDHLTPGGWQVQRATRTMDSALHSATFVMNGPEVKYDTNCTVIEGQTTHFDFDLSDEFGVRLLGHVVFNGAPAVGWRVSACPPDVSGLISTSPAAAVDAQGDVVIRLPRPARYRLEVRQVVEGGTALTLSQELEVHANDNAWNVDLSCGAIEGRVTAVDATRSLSMSWSDATGISVVCDVKIDAEGHFKIPCVPAGSVYMLLQRKNNEAPSGLPEPRQVLVKRGETVIVDWP